MAHVMLGTILLVIVVLMIGIAWALSPLLAYLGISRMARHAFTAMMICLSAYLGAVSSAAFGDLLRGPNYSWGFWAIRIVLLVVCVWFLIAVLRCRDKHQI